MYKLLLVDDRKDVVDGIAQAIYWEEHDILVQTCYNGKSALEVITNEHIDLVVTDIKMPFLSGLDLVCKSKENNLDTCFIILSGYDEFLYAKRAIKLGVVEYLIKPVEMDRLLETVINALKEIKKKNNLKKNMRRLHKQEIHSIPALKTNFFLKMISDCPYSKQEIDACLELFNSNIKLNEYITILISIDQYQNIIETQGKKEIENINFIINNMAKELFSESYVCETFNYEANSIAVIINISKEMDNIENKYNTYLLSKRLHDLINDYFDFTVTIAISNCKNGAGSFRQSVEECLDAMAYRLYKGENKIILSSDIHENKDNAGYPQEQEEQLIKAIMLKDYVSTINIVNNLFDEIINIQEFTPEFIWKKMCNIIIKTYQVTGSEDHIIDILDEFRMVTTLEQMKEWFIQQINKLIKPHMADRHDIGSYIESIKDYVNKNYATNITLKELAENLYISQSYLSSVFKEYTGINFNCYLRDVRIEKAKELLLGGKKVYDVANEVGYIDQKYFSSIFKKSTGFLPKQWMKKQHSVEHSVDRCGMASGASKG